MSWVLFIMPLGHKIHHITGACKFVVLTSMLSTVVVPMSFNRRPGLLFFEGTIWGSSIRARLKNKHMPKC